MKKLLIKTGILIMGLSFLAVFIAGCSGSKDMEKPLPGQHAYKSGFTITKKITMNYLLYLPEDYSQHGQKWPLVLFLHGSGERGDDINLVKRHGPPMLVSKGKQFPFILLSPQCPEGERWSVESLDKLLNKVEAEFNIDLSRVYITGLSMGGYGTWKMLKAFPDRFAAAVPISGGGSTDFICELKDEPIWVFHGKKDKVVPIEEDERMVKALKACGSGIKFTIYPDAGHNAWTRTYNNPEVYEWMLSKVRKKK